MAVVNESSTIQYTVTTTNTADGTVLYWRTSGSTTNTDIVGGNTGSITIINNQATWNVTIASDANSDGQKTLGIELSTVAVDGPAVVATAAPIVVIDTSLTPTYSVSANTISLNEGNSVVFTITTTNVDDGTTLYWTNSGNTAAADFTDSSNSGSVVISGNTATITRTLVNDVTTEGLESIVLQLRTSSTTGNIVYTASLVDVIDTSLTPTYSVSANTATVNESDAVVFTITTTNVSNGTTLYWTNSGNTAAADFTDSSNSGSITISGGSATVTRQLVKDYTTEGTENIVFELRTGSNSGTIVATNTVTVLDTSGNPTYSVTANVASVNEGATVVFTVTTTNVDDGTTLYWTNSGNTAANDFADTANSGSFTISGGSATVSRTLTNDVTTEGTENIVFELRTGSNSGTIVATNTVIVLDTSQTVAANPTYNIVARAASYNEGFNSIFEVRTTDVSNGTNLYWSTVGVSGNFNASLDTISGTSGTLTIDTSRPFMNLGVYLRADSTTEGSESFYVRLRTGSQSGPIVANSNTVIINDTSLDPVGFSVAYMIVSGGGSGSSDGNDYGGGGGGGMLVGGQTLYSGTNYYIDVGAGGSADSLLQGWQSGIINYGAAPFFLMLTSTGGGSGNQYGQDGGSGGGQSVYSAVPGQGVAGQGNRGGYNIEGSGGPGGGGAGGVGSNNSLNIVNDGNGAMYYYNGGNGGIGRQNSLRTGSAVYYAGGGGGGSPGNRNFFTGQEGQPGTGGLGGGGTGGKYTAFPTPGTQNTGGGGGGGFKVDTYEGIYSGQYGSGGSGIVVISYAGAQRATGGTITTVGGNTVHTFTTSGTFITT